MSFLRVRSKAAAWVVLVVAGGGATFALAATRVASAPRLPLALLAAAAVVTEFLVVRQGGVAFQETEHAFAFSSGIYIAAALLLGPWAAAVIAYGAIVSSGVLRRLGFRYVVYNAAVFALACAAAGGVFKLLGGTPGGLDLPSSVGAVAGLTATLFAVNTLLVGAVVSLTTGTSLLQLQRDKFGYELPAVAGEAGFGLALAALAETQPWTIVALVPLVVGLFQAHARLALLHEETAGALEAFANLVDERDPSTFQHSTRVAELVGRLAHALGLPAQQIARLRWAGRLHDLGKIAVDSASLARPHALSKSEWELMRRHPRLSARLLRRFRLAVPEARAIEYHHERYDGKGYYGIARNDVPLAAHFLIVADSYDAMVSDRPYRGGLPRERALATIEAEAGKQFHPAVARAFVALQRGVDPRTVLSPEEQNELRAMTMPSGRRRKHLRLVLHRPYVHAGALVVAVAAVGAGWYAVAAAGLAVVLAGDVLQRIDDRRARRLASVLETAARGEMPFAAVIAAVAAVAPVRWAGLLAWDERGLEGEIVRDWGQRDEAPSEAAVTSWIVRDADVGEELLSTEGALGRRLHVALPLRAGESVSAYLLMQLEHALPRRVEVALAASSGSLAAALVPATSARRPPRLVAAAP